MLLGIWWPQRLHLRKRELESSVSECLTGSGPKSILEANWLTGMEFSPLLEIHAPEIDPENWANPM